jgi:hypothetical protein
MGVETLAIVSAVGTVVGGVMGAIGQYQSQAALQRQAMYQAQVARNNQIISDQNAAYARQASAAQESRQNEKTAAVIGATRAAQASNGLDVNSGSNLDVQSSAEELGQLDAASIRSQGERQARAYENQGAGFADQAALYGMTPGPSMLGLFGNILGAAGSVSSKWASYQQNGVFSGAGSSTGSGGWNV